MICNPLHTCIGPLTNTYQYWVYFFVVSGIDIRIHRIPFSSHGEPFNQKLNYWWIGNLVFKRKLWKTLQVFTDIWNIVYRLMDIPIYVLDMYSCKVYVSTHCTVDKQQYHNSFQDVRLNTGLHYFWAGGSSESLEGLSVN